MMDLAVLWEWAGVSLGREETYLMFLSIKKLVEQKQLKSVRLWGKVLGRDANYIIAEAELKEGVEDTEDAVVNAVPPTEVAEKKDEVQEGPKLTKPKQFGPLSKEQRIGVNKYVYFACNYIGGAWKRLPDVIPERLQEARKIRKYFTGNLDAKVFWHNKVSSYPAFNGNEAQYLRCQIARISAATVISPKGYYMTDPEAEEPEEGAGNMPIIINPEYEGLSNDQLLNVANWVHHTPYILPQGRVTWEAPKVIKEKTEEEKEEDEEEEAEEETAPEPEAGPAPLNTIASDEGKSN
jgi:radial spoke head protein 4A